MHIPDGFLNVATLATTGAVSAGGVACAVRVTRDRLKEKQAPLMGVLAAFIFAAQMLNFPIVAGTSGHFMGAALAAFLLGPWAALLIMTTVLIAQALVFQDGGLLALGANVFNMGIVACFSGYGVYRLMLAVGGKGTKRILAAAFTGAWAATFLASVSVAIEFGLSGASPLKVVLPAMAGVHALLGIAEGLITVAVLRVVMAARSDLVPFAPASTVRETS